MAAKLPSERARSLPFVFVVVCLSLLFLRSVVAPEKAKNCAQSVPSVCVFDLHSSHSRSIPVFFFLFFGEELEPFSFLEL